MESSRLSPLGVALLATVTLGWGLTWPINKLVLEEVPPLTFRGACLVVGGVGVLAIARAGGQSLRMPARAWGPLLALSACNIVGWNVFVIYGIALLPPGRAALLGYTMPLWSTLLSVWLLREPLTAQRAISLVLGMCGVAILLGGTLGAMASALDGVVLTLAAAIAWALGVVLLKRFALRVPTAALTGWMMLVGSVPILGVAAALERERWRMPSTPAALGVLYSVTIAMMLCYWAWNRLVLMVPVAVSSVSSLATPVVGVASAMWILDEPLAWQEIAAGACILGAIALALYSGASGLSSRTPSRSSPRGRSA